MSQSPPDESAIVQSLGDLLGKQASPAKSYVNICNKKTCKKRATYTHEAQDDNSISICVQITQKTYQEHTHIFSFRPPKDSGSEDASAEVKSLKECCE